MLIDKFIEFQEKIERKLEDNNLSVPLSGLANAYTMKLLGESIKEQFEKLAPNVKNEFFKHRHELFKMKIEVAITRLERGQVDDTLEILKGALNHDSEVYEDESPKS